MQEITIDNLKFKIYPSAYTLLIYQKATGRDFMSDVTTFSNITINEKGVPDLSKINIAVFTDLLYALQNPGNKNLTYEAFYEKLPFAFMFSLELYERMTDIIQSTMSIKKESNDNSSETNDVDTKNF